MLQDAIADRRAGIVFRGLISPPRATDEYFHGIDLLRGIAALIVVLVHYRNFFVQPGLVAPIAGGEHQLPGFAALWPAFFYGQFAVQLFWMISGFVFIAVYAHRPVGTRQFFLSRIARLYPLHIVTLVIVAVLQFVRLSTLGNFAIYQENDLYHFVLQLFFASNWGFEQGYSFNAPIWSISLEVLIYAIFWMTLPFLYRIGIVGPLALAAFFSCGGILDWPNTLFWQCGFYFFLGSAIYIAFDILRDRAWIIAAGAVMGLAAFAAILAIRPSITPERLMPILLPSIMLLFCAVDASRLAKLPRWTRWIGDNTYGVYLWHVPVQLTLLLVIDGIVGDREMVRSPFFLLMFVLIVIAVARVSFLKIEGPARRAIRRAWIDPQPVR